MCQIIVRKLMKTSSLVFSDKINENKLISQGHLKIVLNQPYHYMLLICNMVLPLCLRDAWRYQAVLLLLRQWWLSQMLKISHSASSPLDPLHRRGTCLSDKLEDDKKQRMTRVNQTRGISRKLFCILVGGYSFEVHWWGALNEYTFS